MENSYSHLEYLEEYAPLNNCAIYYERLLALSTRRETEPDEIKAALLQMVLTIKNKQRRLQQECKSKLYSAKTVEEVDTVIQEYQALITEADHLIFAINGHISSLPKAA